MAAPRSGDRISSYVLDAPIGTGSFGQVWRARHHIFDECVAIKIPTDADYVQNLRREGVTIHGLRHPNIVRAIDLDPYADPPFLIMEYVPGDSLRAFIDAHPKGMPIESAMRIMQGVLAALVVAHDAGVIHRDIKPANILLTETADAVDGVTSQSVKVADFGLGGVGGATLNSIAESIAGKHEQPGRGLSGTLAYMSPEQKQGLPLDGRSDLYACGIVLFEMLIGDRPQGTELPSAMRPEVSTVLDDVFRRCYARRERRFPNAADMLAALTATASSATTSASTSVAAPTVASAAGRVCPSCHGRAQEDDHYCIHCGQQLVESLPRCRSCNALVEAADRYCIFCGADLRRARVG